MTLYKWSSLFAYPVDSWHTTGTSGTRAGRYAQKGSALIFCIEMSLNSFQTHFSLEK